MNFIWCYAPLILETMIFKKTEDRPNGAIICSKEDVEKLKAKGWVVSMHTNGYANFIGCELNGLSVGFCCYMEHLETDISTPEVGYYSDSWNGDVDIKSQKDLDNYIKIIDCMVALNGA